MGFWVTRKRDSPTYFVRCLLESDVIDSVLMLDQ